MKNARILLIDDDPAMVDLTQYQLQEQGYTVTAAENGTIGLKLASEQRFELALTDLNLPDINGIELVKQLKEISPGIEIIMITGFSSVSDAVEAMDAGAFYFVEKPVEYEELSALVKRALERSQLTEENNQLRRELVVPDRYYNLIGGSKAMQNVYEMIERVAKSDANIMIIGESGTGKELIANAIHYNSLRAKKPFVKINCSALPKELIESELFGHTKGAFTGASSEKHGLIGQATGGSLMLDEIGEMPVELQPKLLRVLQERVYYRIGSEKALESDFRLISATNREPREAINEGHLREDLFYRINTIEIRVPPLRERAEDIQHLVEHFLRVYAEKYQRPVHMISRSAYERMFAYPWPGNVRELQNVIERGVLLCKGNTIEVDALPFRDSDAPAPSIPAPEPVPSAGTVKPNGSALSQLNQEEPLFKQLGRLIVNKVPEVKSGSERFDIFDELEGAIVSAALERTRGNKQAAANLLGVYRPRLYHMLRKHNLHHPQRDSEEWSSDEMVAGTAT